MYDIFIEVTKPLVPILEVLQSIVNKITGEWADNANEWRNRPPFKKDG